MQTVPFEVAVRSGHRASDLGARWPCPDIPEPNEEPGRREEEQPSRDGQTTGRLTVSREPWYESSNPTRIARGASWRVALWVLAIVVFAGLISGGIWAFKVATSGVKGAGDQEQKVNSADNRIFAQEHFFTLYNNLLAYDQQLDQAAADKAEHPSDPFFATNYSGMVKTCIDARNQYNADANKVTQARWRDPQLPYQISELDPKTDCKETPK